MTFKFTKREVYGRPLYFPSCELSKGLLEAFPQPQGPRKSLAKWQVDILKSIGIIVEVKE